MARIEERLQVLTDKSKLENRSHLTLFKGLVDPERALRVLGQSERSDVLMVSLKSEQTLRKDR